MSIIRSVLITLLLVILTGCAAPSKFRSYDGPEVTRVVLLKEARQLQLLHNGTPLKVYNVGLGFAPEGHKQVEGDGKTPEGHYLIDRRNPNSRYHLSVGISYPNARDIEVARGLGRPAGGDIFIHGRGENVPKGARGDWTWGCIAVTDDEIEEIYAMVQDGTPISIFP